MLRSCEKKYAWKIVWKYFIYDVFDNADSRVTFLTNKNHYTSSKPTSKANADIYLLT